MKNKKNKWNMLINIILILILLVGLSLLLYPTFSDYWNSFRQSRAITDYAHIVDDLDEEEYARLWSEAEAFNQSILKRLNLYVLSEEEEKAYASALSIDGSRIMAYLDIPKINCNLPIYHGTAESVLQVAIGHVEWSSLPIGGESTHCVLSGHRGLPSAKLFTDLDEMEIGDQFFITVLGEKLAYEVDQIVTVLPEEVEELGIEEGQDYVTLLTCTPYGVNTHRLLVRGHRIPYTEPETEENAKLLEDVVEGIDFSARFWKTAGIVFSGLIVFIVILLILTRKKKKK